MTDSLDILPERTSTVIDHAAAFELEPHERERLTVAAMEDLKTVTGMPDGPMSYYRAANPGYPGFFARDSLLAFGLSGNVAVLKDQIDNVFRLFGRKYDAKTGEEPGRAHHEWPGIDLGNGLATTYNACDTTAELLHRLAALAELGDYTKLEQHLPDVRLGVDYIKRHVSNDGLFGEDPAFAGVSGQDGRGRHYALKVTDWKDSELNRHDRREPNYPIVYSLAHFNNAGAIERIGRSLGDSGLEQYGAGMIEAGLAKLWNNDHFVTAVDQDGVIDAPSSDSLMVLNYILRQQLPEGYAEKIELYMRQLITPAGYRSGLPAAESVDPYHMGVWIHEQALLNAAGVKHDLLEIQEVTGRAASYIDPRSGFYPELLDANSLKSAGNDEQLWVMGADLYFADPSRALL